MRKALLLGRTNERLVVVCLFSNLPGKRYKKKNKFQGFTERGKKEEVLTSDEKGDEKKREISKSKTNLPKIRSPSLLSWRERVCVCARV